MTLAAGRILALTVMVFDENTATFDVPATPTVTLPPLVPILTFDVPLLMLDDVVDTPVNSAPLPRI